MPGLRHVLRALEHHMLKQMRKTGAPFTLVPRTNIIINRNRHDRDRVIGIQDYAQVVGKRVLLYFKRRQFKGLGHKVLRYPKGGNLTSREGAVFTLA